MAPLHILQEIEGVRALTIPGLEETEIDLGVTS